MLHSVFGRKLNRTSNERKRLFKNLSRSLILNGYIKTTLAKAKAIQPLVEKMVTRAKNTDLQTRRLLIKKLSSREAADKLLKEIAPLFKNKKGGYTRIVKTGNRLGDSSRAVVMTFTAEVANSVLKVKKDKSIKTGKAKKAKEEHAEKQDNKKK